MLILSGVVAPVSSRVEFDLIQKRCEPGTERVKVGIISFRVKETIESIGRVFSVDVERGYEALMLPGNSEYEPRNGRVLSAEREFSGMLVHGVSPEYAVVARADHDLTYALKGEVNHPLWMELVRRVKAVISRGEDLPDEILIAGEF